MDHPSYIETLLVKDQGEANGGGPPESIPEEGATAPG
jgi:hypothetical protein